jgi:hypothetical protein
MRNRLTGVLALAGAFVAGMVVATLLGGGVVAWGARMQGVSALETESAAGKMAEAGQQELRGQEAQQAQQAPQGQKQAGTQVIVDRIISPSVTDADIALLRQDLRAKKMQVIGENLPLTDGEAAKFWPIYNHYVKDLREVNDQKYALLKQYAEMWETMSDEDAMIYVRHWLEADGAAQALRLKYVPVVNQVLPGRKAATFFQLDRRLNMIIDLQLFSQVPLARVKE